MSVKINKYDITMANHYDITMVNDDARYARFEITMDNDVASDITMHNDITLCTYHGVT